MIEVAAAYIEKDGRFLICKRPEGRNGAGLWEFPGGKLEPGETGAQAIVRECREELNIDLTAEERYIADAVRDIPGNTIHLMLFKCRIIGGEFKLLEHTDAKWITKEQIVIEKFCPADRVLINKVFSL